MSNTKIIAFYLPQYHPIPENDEAHGKGFTEWTNVKKALPLFEGHNQPRVPLNKNYYSLLDYNVMVSQANMAKKYGVDGFCYYHYWFKNGKKLLEKPIELMLNHKEVDIPFCMCWANENWTRKWDGENNEVIVEQDYGDFTDLKNHMDYLCEFFSDERYIKIDGKPLFIIYKPEIIPDLEKMVKYIRQYVETKGFPGIVLMSQYPDYYFSCLDKKEFDYSIQFEPQFIRDYEVEKKGSLRKKIKKLLLASGFIKTYQFILGKYQKKKKKELTHRDYDTDWKAIIEFEVKSKKIVAGGFVDWDNTARNKNGLVYDGVTVEKFEKYFGQLYKKVQNEYDLKYIFLNAWNEWAEGAYLEPDEKNGEAYLEAIKKVKENV